MLALPMPLVVSLALGAVLIHVVLKGDRPWLVTALLASCVAQGVVTSLAQHYDVALFRAVQPVTATLIPPLAWTTFQATAVRGFDPKHALPHVAAPALAAFAAAFAPMALDVVVPATFLAYACSLLLALRKGADGLPMTRLETGDWPAFVWAGIALGLSISAVSDGAISLALLAGADAARPWIIAAASTLSLALVGLLVLSRSLAEPVQHRRPAAASAGDGERDGTIMSELAALFTKEPLHLDPDLTLDRIARRLRIPAKQVSAAVNRRTGENVSRYVNRLRIDHACARLSVGTTVAEAIYASGFNTKSNFNREFRRVMGEPPSAWLARARTTSPESPMARTPEGR